MQIWTLQVAPRQRMIVSRKLKVSTGWGGKGISNMVNGTLEVNVLLNPKENHRWKKVSIELNWYANCFLASIFKLIGWSIKYFGVGPSAGSFMRLDFIAFSSIFALNFWLLKSNTKFWVLFFWWAFIYDLTCLFRIFIFGKRKKCATCLSCFLA